MVSEVLEHLKSLGDPRARERWEKMGMNASAYYGVGLTKLKAYAKRLGRNHELAAALWATGVHDARLLATMVEEPRQVTERQVDEWMAGVDFWDLSDKLCTNVVAKTPFARRKMKEWIKSRDEYVKRSGFMLLAELAKAGDGAAESELGDYLDLIEGSLHREPNWAREAMNWALICIGGRSRELNERALAAARRIGRVKVDYGDTSCQVPDAVTHLTGERLRAKLR